MVFIPSRGCRLFFIEIKSKFVVLFSAIHYVITAASTKFFYRKIFVQSVPHLAGEIGVAWLNGLDLCPAIFYQRIKAL